MVQCMATFERAQATSFTLLDVAKKVALGARHVILQTPPLNGGGPNVQLATPSRACPCVLRLAEAFWCTV